MVGRPHHALFSLGGGDNTTRPSLPWPTRFGPLRSSGDPPMSRESHVFVYGTLRRGEVNDITRLRPAPRFVGDAHVAGLL